MSDRDRDSLNSLEQEGHAAIASAARPQAPSDADRERMRNRILGRVQAQPPDGTFTIRSSEGEWREVLPGVHIKLLSRDEDRGRQTVLYRLDPGSGLPAHEHSQDEECLVVEGEINFGPYHLFAGDYHYARAGYEHPAVTTKTGALLLITQALAA